VLAFVLEANISSYDAKVYYRFHDFQGDNFIRFSALFYDSLKRTYKYGIDGSIYHFIFPKVVLAHILSEVGTFA